MSETVEILVMRRFAHPPERVFDAWLDREGLGRWLFRTEGGVLVRAEVDPRVGGRFRIDEERVDGVAAHVGTFVTIDRPNTRVFDFAAGDDGPMTRVTVRIRAVDGGCELTLSHALSHDWQTWADRVENGWRGILDRLAVAL